MKKEIPAPKQTFVPLDDRVLVYRDNEESISPGGIIIPDTAKEKPNCGTVIAVGPEITHDAEGLPMRNPKVRVGDRVVFGKYGGTEMDELLGENFILMRLNDVFGKISQS